MNTLKQFLPDTYFKLSQEEKENTIKSLVNDICKKLKISSIPVMFCDLENDGQYTIGGKFSYNPLQIIINKKFVTGEEIEYLTQTRMDYEIAVSYFLVNAISHECYHYFQFDLVQKLVKGEAILNDEFKQSAYLYFVCLNDKIFASFNKKFNIYTPSDINDRDIYDYSPVELSAEAFAYQITDILGKHDFKQNYNQYKDFYSTTYFFSVQRNIKNGGHLISKSINHSLQTALDFLDYKNKISGLKTNYLGIDLLELEKNVIIASKKWKEKEKKEAEIYYKTIKNI